MNVLVTAGNTQAPLDQVRCITNIFSGQTGARLALEAYQRGHQVTLLTSRPEALAELGAPAFETSRRRLRRYRTFDDLHDALREEVTSGRYDAILHAAAVSDYLTAGLYAPRPGVRFDPARGDWTGEPPRFVDVQAGKVKSSHPELWIRLTPAPKLVDQIRQPWGFRGCLVKFKLEVGVDDAHLLEIAEASRKQSDADLMVANTLEGMAEWAFVGAGEYVRVSRPDLPASLLDRVALHASPKR